MVAIDNVRGHELVQDSRHDLNTDEPTNKAAHHDESSSLIRPVIVGEVAFRFGKHAVQGREEL
jgi:hypothetical protein